MEKKILQSQALVANSAWQSGRRRRHTAATAAAATPASAVRGVLMQATAVSAQCAG